MAWPAAVLPCFISRFLYRPLSVYRLPGGVAATVGAVQPLMVVFISAALLGSPIRLMAVLGAICGTAGVALLVLTPNAALDPVGVAAGLAGAVSMAFGTVLTRKWQPPVPLLTFTAWQLAAMAWLPIDAVWSVRQQLQKLLPQFDFAHLVPFTDAGAALTDQTPRTGLLLRAACRTPADAALLHTVAEALGLNSPDTLHYQDAVRVQRRSVKLSTPNTESLRKLQGFLVAGDSRSARWLKTLLQEGTPLNWPARQWLMASDAPPEGAAPVSRQVCSCLNVREDAITSCLQTQAGSEDQRLAGLQGQLRCGTQCGSCVPELRKIIRLVPQPV